MKDLQSKLQDDLKSGLRAKEEEKVSVLRMLISAIRNQEISQKISTGELSDEEVQKVIMSEIKKRKDSIISYEEAGRDDLAKKEKQEIEILQDYLPDAMSEEELKKIVEEVVNTTDDKNFGKIMGQVMGRVQGRADGNQVSAMVKKFLG